jgi:AcrR family transcriptional regulator
MPGSRVPEPERRTQILRAALDVAVESGIGEMTMMRVALRAQLSPGLISFHFGSKRQLLLELLEFVLAKTLVPPVYAGTAEAGQHFAALVHGEMQRLAASPRVIRLAFDFWAAGIYDADIRAKVDKALRDYRNAFRAPVEALIASDPSRYADVSPDAMIAVAVSIIKGSAVQAMLDPEGFVLPSYLDAAHRLLGWRAVGDVASVA